MLPCLEQAIEVENRPACCHRDSIFAERKRWRLCVHVCARARHRATAPGRRERNEKVAKKVEVRNKKLLKQTFAMWKVYSEENHRLLLKHKDKINRVRQALWTMMKVHRTGGRISVLWNTLKALTWGELCERLCRTRASLGL